MEKIKTKSILVIFGKKLPKKNQRWWQQFDRVVGPRNIKEKIQSQGSFFIDIETLVDFGSVQQAYELVNKLPHLTTSDGRVLSKLINYQGYELWWMNYDSIYYKFCLPYTQYHRLLLHLKDFDKIYLYQAPWPYLFRYFLKAHHRQCIISKRFCFRNLLPIPFGIFIQIVLSVGFLPWLKVIKPGLIIWTSDKFDPPRDHDFRHRFIYEELRSKNVPFMEFVRSLESWPVVLQHAWQRKRPVFYSTAIIGLIYFFANLFGKKKELTNLFVSSDPEQRFWFLIATHYLNHTRGTIWSINVIKFILQWAGIKTAIITVGVSRTFHELLACKLAGIKTVGIQHGAQIRYYCPYDFMLGFDGQKPLSVDRYGLWSDWWKEYFLEHSRAYKPEQLYVSGHMRPLKKKEEMSSEINLEKKKGPLRVLFISEQLAASLEIMPYLLTLLKLKDFDLYLKFRPYRDGFELWLKENQPKVYKEILARRKILRGTMEEAISHCDVVVGSHSTAVLEGLMQLKPFVFFRTEKWGDYFDIKSFDNRGHFFAENPRELINCVKNSVNVSKEDLKRMQNQFFGDPYKNGSKWEVEQAIKFLYEKSKIS